MSGSDTLPNSSLVCEPQVQRRSALLPPKPCQRKRNTVCLESGMLSLTHTHAHNGHMHTQWSHAHNSHMHTHWSHAHTGHMHTHRSHAHTGHMHTQVTCTLVTCTQWSHAHTGHMHTHTCTHTCTHWSHASLKTCFAQYPHMCVRTGITWNVLCHTVASLTVKCSISH